MPGVESSGFVSQAAMPSMVYNVPQPMGASATQFLPQAPFPHQGLLGAETAANGLYAVPPTTQPPPPPPMMAFPPQPVGMLPQYFYSDGGAFTVCAPHPPGMTVQPM